MSAALSEAGNSVTLSVATALGRDMAAGGGVTVLADRLGESEIVDLLKGGEFEYVVDATHPYAVIATQNIRSACRAADVNYLRLKRPESAGIDGITYVADECGRWKS